MANNFNRNSEEPAGQLLTYLPSPYWGGGPGQTCVSLLENIPDDIFSKILVLPRVDRAIAKSITVKQTVSFIRRRLPYNWERGIVSLNKYFPRMIETVDPDRTIVH